MQDSNPRPNYPRRGRGAQHPNAFHESNNIRKPNYYPPRVVSRRPPAEDITKEEITQPVSIAESDPTTCSICHGDEIIRCVAPCNHDICYRCSVRLRYLLNQFDCPICRADAPKVLYIITDVGPFKSYNTSRFFYEKRVKGLFQNPTVEEAFNQLISHVCQFCEEQEAGDPNDQGISDKKELKSVESFKIFKLLQEHVRKTHQMYYCEICVENVKLFTKERKCYDRTNLALHKRKGDADDKSFKGHPLCEHCDKRYLDTDELFRHLRRDHFYCHFCDAEGKHIYFLAYRDVAHHFQTEHYLCDEGECARAQFTNAYANKIDFQAHKAEEHCYGNRQDQRTARTIGLDFRYGENERSVPGRGMRQNQAEADDELMAAISSSMEAEAEAMVADVHSTQDFPSLGRVRPPAPIVPATKPPTAKAIPKKPKSGVMMFDDDEQFPTMGRSGPTPVRSGPTPTRSAPLHALTEELPRAPQPAPVQPPKVTMAAKIQNRKEPLKLLDDEQFPALGGRSSAHHKTPNSVVPKSKPKPEPKSVPKRQANSAQPKSAPNKSIVPKSAPSKRAPPKDPKTLIDMEFPTLPASIIPKDPTWQAKMKAVKSEPKIANNGRGYRAANGDYPALEGNAKGYVAPAQWYKINQTQKTSRKATASFLDLSEPDPEIERQLGKQHRKDQSALPPEGRKIKEKQGTVEKKNAHDVKKSGKQEKQPESTTTTTTTTNSTESFLANTKLPTFSTTSVEISQMNSSNKLGMVESTSVEPVQAAHSSERFKFDKSDYPSIPSSTSTGNTALWVPASRPSTAPPGLTKKEAIPILSKETASGAEKSGYTPTGKPFQPSPGLLSDDFPSLSGSQTKATPTGLQAKPKLGRVSASSSSDGGKFKFRLAKSKGCPYNKPGDFGNRSRLLIRLIRDEAGEETFGKFQQLLQDYRTGGSSVGTFISHCETTIGQEVLIRVLPELIALLPDIDKQQELFLTCDSMLQQSYFKLQSLFDEETADNLVLLPCESCGQILILEDLQQHEINHV